LVCCVDVGFLTGVLQNHARKYEYAIDHLTFEFNVLRQYRDQSEVAAASANLKYGEQLEADKQIESPKDGVLIHGLFMDGFRWDDNLGAVEDSLPGEMSAILPVVCTLPKTNSYGMLPKLPYMDYCLATCILGNKRF